jgi:hypothetical protein
MAASVRRLVPVLRNQGQPVPNLIQLSEWIDSLILAASTAKNYAMPLDAQNNAGRIYRITATAGPIYLNFYASATIPSGDTTNGSSSVMLRTDLGPQLMFAPDGIITMSLISPAPCIVTIENWY